MESVPLPTPPNLGVPTGTVTGDGAGPAVAHIALDPHMLLAALQKMRSGDFSVRLPGDRTGIDGKVADTLNDIVEANERMAAELKRVGETVGRRGKTRRRAKFGRDIGAWGEMEGSINTLIDDLLWPTTEMTRAVSAVARGALM